MNSCSLLAHSVCLKCSEMRLLKIWTDLSFLIPPVEPSVSEAEMDTEENPPPSPPLGLLTSPAKCPASVSGSLPRRMAVPSLQFHGFSLPLCFCTGGSLLLASIPLYCLADSYLICSSHLDLGTTFPGSAPILPYRLIWVKGLSCLLQIAPPNWY